MHEQNKTVAAEATSLENEQEVAVPRVSLKRNIVILMGGTAFSQLLLLISAPLLTRLYTPENFGVLAVYVSLLSILLTICALCYERAIPLAEDDVTVVHLQVLCLLILGGLSVLTFLVLIGLRSKIVQWTKSPEELRFYLLFLPISLLGGGVYQILSFVAVRRQNFKQLAASRMFQSAGQIGVQLGFGVSHLGLSGLISGDVVGRAVSSTAMIKQEIQRQRVLQIAITWEQILQAAKRYRRFPQFSMGSALLNSLGIYFPPFLLALLYGMQVVGWYSLGQRIIALPMLLVGNSVGQVYFGEAARLRQENPPALLDLFFKTTRRLLILGILPILFLGLFSPFLFGILFGANWETAGRYVQLLAPMFLLQFITSPLGGTLDVTERQDLHFYREIVRVFLLLGAFGIARFHHFNATSMIAALSAAGALSYVFYLFVSWYALLAEKNHAAIAS